MVYVYNVFIYFIAVILSWKNSSLLLLYNLINLKLKEKQCRLIYVGTFRFKFL